MTHSSRMDVLLPCLLLLGLTGAALLFRPLLPVDETRYMSVAWEMFQQKHYAVLSLNFSPYHHKPPMLFWLVNLLWETLGVSRWSALVPIFAASASVLFLSKKLAERLFPETPACPSLVPWMMLGSAPFLIYSTLVMFDMMLTAILLGTLILSLDYARNPSRRTLILSGLLIGAGVLTKGPVMYLYVLWPLALYPFWKRADDIPASAFYKALGLSVLISFLPILAWLVPALTQTDGNFAFWLVWNQTAGRISGNFSSAHVRPVFFYLVLLPALFLPWVFLPAIWKDRLSLVPHKRALCFLAAATLPIFISFSLISGKQPHYLLPLLPFVIIGLALLASRASALTVKSVSIGLVFLLITGQAIAAYSFFPKYDLAPFAEFYRTHSSEDWAFVGKYQGEIGFLSRAEKKIQSIEREDLPAWFDEHPTGFAIIRYEFPEQVLDVREIYSRIYRGKRLGIFQKKETDRDTQAQNTVPSLLSDGP